MILAAAREYARLKQKRTFEETWPAGLTRRRSRNIPRYREFARTLSKIVAQNAVGTAWVLAPPSPGDAGKMSEPPQESVWASDELPALKENSKVDQVVWVRPVGLFPFPLEAGYYWGYSVRSAPSVSAVSGKRGHIKGTTRAMHWATAHGHRTAVGERGSENV